MSTQIADDYAVVAAGMRMDTPAGGAGADGPDAELIRLCARLVELKAADHALISTHHTIEGRTEPLLSVIYTEEAAILDRLYSLAPVTLAGATAMAWAAVALTPPRVDVALEWPPNPEDWLAMGVEEFLADQGGKQGHAA